MDNKYLSDQLITYIGNKRKLLDNISAAVACCENVQTVGDLFSGSGVCARLFKTLPSVTAVVTNDLERYNQVINNCYLSNPHEFDSKAWDEIYQELIHMPLVTDGIIYRNYAPKITKDIQSGERVFYTAENAQKIDTYRQGIDKICPDHMKPFFIAPLLSSASVHTNTSGVFKGFYKDKNTGLGAFGGTGKNALDRIMGPITIDKPVLHPKTIVHASFNQDINQLITKLPHLDLIYLDPPYNQHPYGSNYFMLNVINDYVEPQNISRVSGIPADWNRSPYNSKQQIAASLEDVVNKANARYILLSYSSDGFLSQEELISILEKYGSVSFFSQEYNTFRGCRNLVNRDIHIQEYLFLLKKE